MKNIRVLRELRGSKLGIWVEKQRVAHDVKHRGQSGTHFVRRR